jgi:hypothetical protein
MAALAFYCARGPVDQPMQAAQESGPTTNRRGKGAPLERGDINELDKIEGTRGQGRSEKRAHGERDRAYPRAKQSQSDSNERKELAEDELYLFHAAREVCPGDADLSFFKDLFLNPGAAMGVAYTVFLLALLYPVVWHVAALLIFAAREWTKCNTKTDSLASKVVDKSIGLAEAQACEQAETMGEEQAGLLDEGNEGNNNSAEVAAEQDAAIEKHGDLNALRLVFAATQFLLLLAALVEYLWHVPYGAGWQCRVALIASAPLAKTISVPMWVVLLDVGQFSHWLLNRQDKPKDQTGIPAGTPPLDANGYTFFLMLATTVLFVAWFAMSLPGILLLLAFPVSSFFAFFAQPVAIMVLLPTAIKWAMAKVELLLDPEDEVPDLKFEGVSGSFTLKIAASQSFCAVGEMTKFLHLYSDFDSYWPIFRESLYSALALLPRFIRALTSVGLPSFSMPTLYAGLPLDCFKLSLLLAVLSHLLVPAVDYYKKNGLKTHGQAYFFVLEEVMLRPGEEDDCLCQVEETLELEEEDTLAHPANWSGRYADCNTNAKLYEGSITDEVGAAGSEAKRVLHVVAMHTGRYRLKAWQTSWYLACVLNRVAMFSTLAVSAAERILVWGGNLKWRKELRGEGDSRKWADKGVYMGSDERRYHEQRTEAKYLSLWALVPYVTPIKNRWQSRRYDFVSMGMCKQFVKDNPGVKALHLSKCANLARGVLEVVAKNCLALEFFSICFNRLTCSIPSSLSRLTQMRLLDLYANNLTGSIPASLGEMKEMRRLGLNNNQLTGSIPASLGTLKDMAWFWVHCNSLAGKRKHPTCL